MIQAKARFERKSFRYVKAVLSVSAECRASFISLNWRVAVWRLTKLIVDCIEAENEHVIVDSSQIRNIRVRVELPPFKTVIRNPYLAIEKREALLRDETAPIRELMVQLHCRDVA